MMHRFDRETLEGAETDLVMCLELARTISDTESPFRRAECIGRLRARIENAQAGIRLAIRMVDA